MTLLASRYLVLPVHLLMMMADAVWWERAASWPSTQPPTTGLRTSPWPTRRPTWAAELVVGPCQPGWLAPAAGCCTQSLTMPGSLSAWSRGQSTRVSPAWAVSSRRLSLPRRKIVEKNEYILIQLIESAKLCLCIRILYKVSCLFFSGHTGTKIIKNMYFYRFVSERLCPHLYRYS